MRDDIALIKVVDPTLDSDGLPLAQNGSILSDCFVLGYGASSNAGKPSGELRIGKVRLISQSFCVDLLGRITAPTGSDGKMCALGLGANTCPVSIEEITICFICKLCVCVLLYYYCSRVTLEDLFSVLIKLEN